MAAFSKKMMVKGDNIITLFFIMALVMLVSALVFGILSAGYYLNGNNADYIMEFRKLRPFHVSSALFWVLMGSTACVYFGLREFNSFNSQPLLRLVHILLWTVGIAGIFYSYFTGHFGGREYWEYNPFWSFFLASAWLVFLYNFYSAVKNIRRWPVYIWMWMTGIVFFFFIFLENHLWLFPYFRADQMTDMTIQWKVNGSIVGSWNQIIYGTAIYLLDKISGTITAGRSKTSFLLYFLGLLNLMFNWGHHIYTLPTQPYVHHVGYLVSMTEWIILLRIIYHWKKNLTEARKFNHHLPYKFLLAADFWIFVNLILAIPLSIPAINIYAHGTFVIMAHAMGTTIGINTMILFAAIFEYVQLKKPGRLFNISFWGVQISLAAFFVSLNVAGILKGMWQILENKMPFGKMFESLHVWFEAFFISGFFLGVFLFWLAVLSLKKLANRSQVAPPGSGKFHSEITV